MTGEQLKKSILQYAIQGKLVPQNPGDEPAKDLLKKIQDEKQKLIAEKKIKKDRNESFIYREGESFYEVRGKVVACIDDEIPFEIPESWEWARLGHLSTTIQYGYNAPAKEKGDIRFVRISDIQSGRVIWPSVPFCDIKEEDVLKYSLDTGDVLFARTGGTVGKSFFIKQMEYPAVFAGYLIRVKIHDKMFPEYIYKFMSSAFYWQQLRQGTVATAQPNCNAKTLAHMLIPVPPFEEQKRIVAKIEELLPYVEEYSAAEAAIGRLNKKLPEQLKKSILQYAIQGKLVSQCSKDRPAKALIKEIQEEKKQLIAEKKLKKDKNESFIYREGESFYEVCGKEVDCIDEEIPFDIPESWEWARLGFLSTYGSPTKKVKLRDVSSDTWCLELADIRKGGTLEKIQLAKESDSKGEKWCFPKEIFYIANYGLI